MEKKNILIIGGGGREHALGVALKKSDKVGKLYALPGNAGLSQIAECHPIAATDIEGILEFIGAHPDIYMTVVAPDDPLSMGLVDRIEQMGGRAFGPRKNAAIIESSKAYAKELMQKYGIPTAKSMTFDDYALAEKYIQTCAIPTVLKADGLALGKGVLICNTRKEAEDGLKTIMVDRAFGAAGDRVIVEQFLTGFEVSVLCFCDGHTIVPMVSSQDHKRAFDNDQGPNTGGMGAFSPSPRFTEALAKKAYETIYLSTMNGLNSEGRQFKGVIYFGLMIEGEDIAVLEYNARFGDPETQVVLPRLNSDLFDIFDAIIDEKLAEQKIEWSTDSAVCVVAASGGYPGSYEKGKPVTITPTDGVTVYHAGTAIKEGKTVTSGGRVLCTSATAPTLKQARELAYKGMDGVKFEGMFYRTDIGKDKDI